MLGCKNFVKENIVNEQRIYPLFKKQVMDHPKNPKSITLLDTGSFKQRNFPLRFNSKKVIFKKNTEKVEKIIFKSFKNELVSTYFSEISSLSGRIISL